MFLDPDKLKEYSPADILDAAARGQIGLDHRFLKAILDRPAESRAAVLSFAERDRSNDAVDIAPELTAFFRHWKMPEAVPFFVNYIREDPEELPDEAIEALVEIGAPALDPLLALYGELDESESGEVAFVLASLRVRDDRVLQLLIDRLEFDLTDAAMMLGLYGDPAAIPSLDSLLPEVKDDRGLQKEIRDAIDTIGSGDSSKAHENPPFDIWCQYPKHADPSVDLLNEDERAELLDHPVAAVRAAAAASFFNRDIDKKLQAKLLAVAKSDASPAVRARGWEALMNATEDSDVVEAMLAAMRNPSLAVEERGGLLVGLAPEADRNEVRQAIIDLYNNPEGRAKALEAMWRSVHPGFRDYFAKHLDDPDLEVRRGALWGIGYFGLRSELDRVRKLFADEDLRSDALFAYSLAIPSEVSRSRMRALLARIEKEANGLSDGEEELVKAALDERLMLAGKEPVFMEQED